MNPVHLYTTPMAAAADNDDDDDEMKFIFTIRFRVQLISIFLPIFWKYYNYDLKWSSYILNFAALFDFYVSA